MPLAVLLALLAPLVIAEYVTRSSSNPARGQSLSFAPEPGFYPDTVTISLSASGYAPGATIYYTTDGSLPGPDNGHRYDEPIRF